MSGYIRIARGIMDHPIIGVSGQFSRYEAWNWLLFEAAWKPRQVRIVAGRTQVAVDLQRSQLSHSLRFIARKWGWSIKRVRTFLDRLEADTMITTQTDTHQTIISICKYDDYQHGPSEGGTQTDTQTGTQWARNGHKEEVNKESKDSIRSQGSRTRGEPEGFPDWYGIFPRKRKRKDAARAFAKVLASGEITLDDLMARTKAFAAHWAKQPKDRLQFCPYPASWINSGEYLDEPEAAAGAAEVPKIEAPIRNPNSFTESDWRDRLAPYRATGQWAPDHWGPPPGAEGCLVPAHLQQTASAQPTENGRG